MTAGETEQAESPSDTLNVKRIEAEADARNGVQASSTIVDGDEKETGNKSSTPSEESEAAMPPLKKLDTKASKGEEMPKSKIAIIMAALCVCSAPHCPHPSPPYPPTATTTKTLHIYDEDTDHLERRWQFFWRR
jgi:hypothetical protein